MSVKDDCSTKLNTDSKIELSADAQKAQELLGSVAEELSPDELSELIGETRFLAESWLNDFERQAFDGKTLQEILYEEDIRHI